MTKIQELESKIDYNKTMRDKLIQMLPLLRDKNGISDCETQIREYQKYVEYFTEELNKLKSKSSPPRPPPTTDIHPRSNPPPPTPAHKKKKYTNLDLLMSETPINKPKVSLKLHELEYKLDVEKTVLKGIKGMMGVLESSADRKSRSDVYDKMLESTEKLGLLNSALRKYKSLYIGEGGEDDDDYELETPPSARLPPGLRRPVTGKLQLEILEATELAHAPTRMIRSPSTVVYVKVDSQVVFCSRPSRSDRWTELCETHVNKASEIEISVHDQSSDKSLPIGIFWLKINDITEGLRKRKIPQWIMSQQQQQQQDQLQVEQDEEEEEEDPASPLPSNVQTAQNADEGGIEAWFDVEPVGKMALRVNFVRTEGKRRPMDKLGRVGALRQRREAVVEVNGHQFLEKRFYNVMKCALCQEFFVNSGYQCADCEYTCHKKCSSKVVTRCISNSKEGDSDEAKLNHNIPHRFEPITNIGANWCCHCGYVLPLGSRGAKKCHICGITAHTRCERFVPDFCGLSMEMANQMLAEIKAATRRKTSDKKEMLPPIPKSDELSSHMSQMNLAPKTPPTMYHEPPQHPITLPQRVEPSIDPVQQQLINQQMLHQQHLQQLQEATKITAQVQTPPPTKRKVALDNFSFLAVLGKGNFGKVMLAEDKYDNELYAIKMLKKRYIIDNEEIESVRSEKRVFQTASQRRHPFLINLHSTFQTETRVYFVMEYVSGGDLMWHIQSGNFSERRAKFYAAEVLLGLEYFHSQDIIYRDLKLDNIMLGLDGHIKIADYGLCKEEMGYGNVTGTFCGTPEFMAPEILKEQNYGRAVDWWAFGVLIYEMLLGQSPFRGEDEDEIFAAILEDEILYPINMTSDAISICQQLLQPNPQRRLGGGPEDAAAIKNHSFFRGVNWDDMLAKRVPPPFQPNIKDRLDISNFDVEFTHETPALTPIHANLDAVEQQEFRGFSYAAAWIAEAT